MEKVVFELFGLTLLEPLSTLMNWVLAVQCGIYYRQLNQVSLPAQRWWRWFFLAYAISLTFGGASHLFYEYTGMLGKIPGWTFAILAVACAELAMIQLMTDPKKAQLLKTVVRSKVFATFVLLMLDFSFKWVAIQTMGLLFFVGIIGWQKHQEGKIYARHFLYGLAFLVAMAIVNALKLDVHPAYFNREDIAHFAMLVAYWQFFRGVKKLG